ncbi:antitoxin MazE-like protein [Aurantimonas sp. C2-6-R+9]|uniref:antitoxin MazE-like protein n=1 Tax=unclassified Aurantimonas TaxID=2638230 RepID=UPI002E18DBF3|nr:MULTISPECIES: antitoxin MazE-like protein [unclassified Aurantimonas]MEC5291054.1 antitoxin MazE-like protein [Aurantimonas sp. C2-3-R2]MEC5381383.1 antitoxin MazE-like protein [Aurantimonas sp. C2-6-R+9]MEC5412205.1 antitoxin MazE-like protein [Aurantimonas sp. C2-4-R8]
MGRPKELTEEQRADLRARGFVPVEVWVPDWDSPEFKEQLKRDCDAINAADRRSGEINCLSEEVADLWDDLPS